MLKRTKQRKKLFVEIPMIAKVSAFLRSQGSEVNFMFNLYVFCDDVLSKK